MLKCLCKNLIFSFIMGFSLCVSAQEFDLCKLMGICTDKNSCYCLNDEIFCPQETDDFAYQCKDGSNWKEHCTSCSCSNNMQICSFRSCSSDYVKSSSECEDGSEWRDYGCNFCRCENRKAKCKILLPQRLMSSDVKPAVYITSKKLTENQKLCKEGNKRMDGCNRCTCVYGSEICENKECPDDNVCTLPVDPGPCQPFVPIPRYAFKNGMCRLFYYGGCEGNNNNFLTKRECNKACGDDSIEDICKLPVDAGPCQPFVPIPRYAFDNGKCMLFFYGGCEGNQNNFLTKTECSKACGEDMSTGYSIRDPKRICNLPIKIGPCKAAIPRFAFNVKAGKCEHFTFGGCEANENNFLSIEECDILCNAESLDFGYTTSNPKEKCSLPLEGGTCLALFTRYGFNSAKGQCEEFTYGGCEGNENNFMTIEECQNECGGTPLKNVSEPPKIEDKCSLPVEVGPCEALFPRFAFFSEKGTCNKFTFGGCDGNENNFMTLEECEHECRSRKPSMGGNTASKKKRNSMRYSFI